MRKTFEASFLAGAILALASLPAHAALGGSPTIPESTQTSNGINVDAAVSAGSYSVRQETLASGTKVREYVTTGGVVFGVAWSGPTQPDLQTLFGSSTFSDYASALQNDTTRNPMRGGTETVDGITIVSWGVPGNFGGRAWVADLLPSGVTSGVVQ